jgi:hypothetical protein
MLKSLLSFLTILLVGFVFRRIFPSKEKIERKSLEEINREMNFFWLILYFLILSLLIYFLYSLSREIQFFILNTFENKGFDILVLNLAPFALPIGFFAVSGGAVLFFEIFFNKKFIFSKIEHIKEPDKKQEYYRALMGCLHYGENFLGITKKIYEIISIIIGTLFLIATILNIDYYLKIDEEGIYKNNWLSLGKEDFYPWKEIESIYFIKGLILKTNKYEKNSIYELRLRDGKKITLRSDYFRPVNHSFEEIINFMVKNSHKRIECKIKDLRNREYIDCSKEKEIMKMYPLKEERY